MCNLCSTDPKVATAARSYSYDVADRLRILAKDYEEMAKGSIKPHTEASKLVGTRARNLIRDLVEEWV